jgi:hypothetical protein
MPKTLTPLVITTAREHAPGQQFAWNKLQNPTVFIGNIVTHDLDLESEELGRLISGVPTPFARAAMFRYALSDPLDRQVDSSGLRKFYRSLQDEWKGLVACLALENQDVAVERIDLAYSDGRDQHDTANLYEPTGALGSMLFDDRDFWCDQEALQAQNQRKVPFLQLIKVGGQVVGATSPESLLFTAASYRVRSAKGLSDDRTGRFADPLRANLSADDLTKLWLYVRHISANVTTYSDRFSRTRAPRLRGVSTFLEGFLHEIRQHAGERMIRLNENAIKPTFTQMQAPFDTLFNIRNQLFGYRGIFAVARDALPTTGGGVVEVELDELLLNPATTSLAEIVLNDPNDARAIGFHALQVPVGREVRLYALPLSESGLAIFQDALEGLLGGRGDVRSRLSATYDSNIDALRVTLALDVSGVQTVVERVYSTPQPLQGPRVACWPDFVSKDWKDYYLYSEMPHNSPEWSAQPIRADRDTFGLKGDVSHDGYRFEVLYDAGRPLGDEASARLVVEYDMGRINAAELKYEIYRSEHPYKALLLRHRGRPAGYVVFQHPNSGHPGTLKQHTGSEQRPVRIGVDFGSNNTCISYNRKGEQSPQLLQFRNRRRFLMGSENPEGPRFAATPGEVFFFQNEPTWSNTIKSMIMIHDERRIRSSHDNRLVELQREVSGGFPVFEKNIPVDERSESLLSVKFDAQPSHIKYNMKWSEDPKENAYKTGLLKTLWLKTCAELFVDNLYPETLIWAYPSAMGSRPRMRYAQMWNEVVKTNPFRGRDAASVAEIGGTPGSDAMVPIGVQGSADKALTEATAVCRHALVQNVTVAADSVFIGFDVGGSTTDILCVASKRGDRDAPGFRETLIKESSIRIAAGILSDATGRSQRFQEVLRQYCRQTDLVIHGVTVAPDRLNARTAPYYYNQLIDRLDTEAGLADLYRNIAASCPELLSLNAYMTGLILFYAGQLGALVRRTQASFTEEYQEPFSKVTVGFYGKGGRMFDWIPAAVGKEVAFQYYQGCLTEGYGPGAPQELRSVQFRPSDPKHVKAEVSFGLASTREVHHTPARIHELVGEDGYRYEDRSLTQLDGVMPDFFLHIGNQLRLPEDFPRFTQFLVRYRNFAKAYFGLEMPDVQGQVARMHLIPFVQNLPSYHHARSAMQRGEAFDFEAPFIILQGMCFLEQVLIPHLFHKA